MTEKHLTNQRFEELDLPEALLRGVSEAGFQRCTPIQAESLPPALDGEDVAGQARTGTGKTASFLLATFAYLLRHPPTGDRVPHQPRALVLAPTRELAVQIHADAAVLGKYTGFRLGLAYGGTGYEQQRREIADGVDVLIGTPGRLIDYHKQRVFDLKAIQVAVIDEADRMFDLGFIRDVRFLLRRMPPPEQRLNMLYSATLSHRVNELAYEHMNDPHIVKVQGDRITVDEVSECVYYPAKEEKIPLLLGILRHSGASRTLVFTNTKHVADEVESWLESNGQHAGVLSGDVPQRKRETLLQAFKDGEVPVLVATDVAARGLHIPDVSHVVNYDLPQDPEDYVHRIGRTARAGASGDAISFACEAYAFSMTDIEAYIGHSIPVGKITDDLLVEATTTPARRRGGRSRAARPGGGREPSQRRGRRRPEKAAPAAAEPDHAAASAPGSRPSVTETESSRPRGKRRGQRRRDDATTSPPTDAVGAAMAAQGGTDDGGEQRQRSDSRRRSTPRERRNEIPAIG